jgi:hypothetical protein
VTKSLKHLFNFEKMVIRQPALLNTNSWKFKFKKNIKFMFYVCLSVLKFFALLLLLIGAFVRAFLMLISISTVPRKIIFQNYL